MLTLNTTACRWKLLTLVLFAGTSANQLRADDAPPANMALTTKATNQFESFIRPILIEKCQKCHGVSKQWGGLRLDSRIAMLNGGESGPAIVPGKPEESLLIKAIRHDADAAAMPPKEPKLSEKQIVDFVVWIKQGAVFPEKSTSPNKRDPNHWAFQPIGRPAIPNPLKASDKSTTWSRRPIDSFIRMKHDHAGIAPANDAPKRSLMRRVSFDLTGLPPTPDEVDEFLSDERPDAYERLIDRLLASPAYGERWARHWLDVARYADSNGLDENVAHGNAWRYRDYVIDAINEDRPYDQFLIEQIAGDLLPSEGDSQRQRHLIATGFLALGPKVLAEVDEAKMEMDIVDEQIDTVGRAVLALTLGCARCHDHKFDPIETSDYYGLAGIFKSTKTMEHFKKVAKWYENPLPSPESAAIRKAFDDQVAERKAALQLFIEQANSEAKAGRSEGDATPANLEEKYSTATREKLKQLRAELAQLEKSPPELPTAMGTTDGLVADVAINIRGNPLKLGDVIPRRMPKVLAGFNSPTFAPDRSGRLELARWITDPAHPLTTRVLVNRVWRWHFGKGLVRSVDNFGLLGEPPSHPELLDWLARRFMERNWSIKNLHRDLLESSTYQLDSKPADPSSFERDPSNSLFGRADVRRLEAEEFRDALFLATGQLDNTMHGSLLTVKNRAYFFDHTSKDLTDYSSHRRSIYLPVVRNNLYDVFALLDFPDAAIPNGDRTTTTVAPQALFMMNSELVSGRSADFVSNLFRMESASDEKRLKLAFLSVFGRPPTDEEVLRSTRFLNEVEPSLGDAGTSRQEKQRQAWSMLCQVMLSSNEFVYLR